MAVRKTSDRTKIMTFKVTQGHWIGVIG